MLTIFDCVLNTEHLLLEEGVLVNFRNAGCEETGRKVVLSDAFVLQVIKRFMDRSIPMVPPATLSVVDVRDVARAHVRALTASAAADNRHIVTNQCISVKDMATALAKEFKPHGWYLSHTFAVSTFIVLKMWIN